MEALASASSVIAVVSVAVQLADSVKKLVEFWRDLQDVPADAAAVFEDLEVLSLVLTETRRIGKSAAFDTVAEKVLSNCDRKVTNILAKIQLVLKPLRSRSAGRRSWATFKHVLGKKQIDELQKSISRAKSTLQIVLQNYTLELVVLSLQEQREQRANSTLINHFIQQTTYQTTAVIDKQPDAPRLLLQNHSLEELSLLFSKLPSSHEMKSRPSRSPDASDNISIGQPLPALIPSNEYQYQPARTHVTDAIACWEMVSKTPVLTLHARTRTRKIVTSGSSRQEIAEKTSEYFIYPQNWLRIFGLSYGVQISAASTRGWKYFVEPFRAVPADSLIFDFCRSGNLEGVKTLFKRGDASPWDRDPLGRTPLWVAAQSLNITVAELLLQEGADVYAREWARECEPISTIMDSPGIEISPKLSMFRLLQNYSRDGYEYTKLGHLLGRGFIAYRPQKPIEMSRAQRGDAVLQLIYAIMPSFDTLHTGDRLKYMTSVLESALCFYMENKVVQCLLHNMDGYIIQDGSEFSVIHEAISKRLLERDPESMKMIVQKTKNLHCRKKDYLSLLTQASTPTMLAMHDAGLFSLWRNLLHEVGVDMKDFVRRELEEGPLGGAGWDKDTLQTLFDYDTSLFSVSENSKTGFGFPSCDRCGEEGSLLSSRLKVDLEWRRLLRSIRLREQPNTRNEGVRSQSKIREITVSLEDNSDHPHTDSACDSNHSLGRNLDAVPLRDGLKVLPYRIVCSTTCRDGVCVAWLYENNTIDEPEHPVFLVPKFFNTSIPKGHIVPVVTYETHECPVQKMPGSFPS